MAAAMSRSSMSKSRYQDHRGDSVGPTWNTSSHIDATTRAPSSSHSERICLNRGIARWLFSSSDAGKKVSSAAPATMTRYGRCIGVGSQVGMLLLLVGDLGGQAL